MKSRELHENSRLHEDLHSAVFTDFSPSHGHFHGRSTNIFFASVKHQRALWRYTRDSVAYQLFRVVTDFYIKTLWSGLADGR